MRRIAMTAVTALTALACALLPSGALAHGHHHRGNHYARRARHHHRQMHAGLFGAGSAEQPTGDPGSAGSTGTGSRTETVGPTTSTQPGDAGKIVSFTEEGVLTIELGEGEKATTISGKVTEETEIHCIPAPSTASTSTTAPSGEDGWSDGSQGQQGASSWGEQGASHDDQGAGDDREGDRDEEGGGACRCSTANLTPGTVVHQAELSLTESGAVFREIELVR